MTLEEYLKEMDDMGRISLKAFLEAPRMNHSMNPIWDRNCMILKCSNWYMEMRQTLEAIKGL